MSLRRADFRCAAGHEKRDVIVDLRAGETLRDVELRCSADYEPAGCAACPTWTYVYVGPRDNGGVARPYRAFHRSCAESVGVLGVEIDDEGFHIAVGVERQPLCPHPMRHFWPLGTRMAVHGDENVPKDLLQAAREGNGRDIEPYTGPDSRAAFNTWQREQGIVHASTPDERQRRLVINSKTKVTKSAEWNQRFEERWKDAEQIAKHPEGDAYQQEFSQIGGPKESDVELFKQQVSGGHVDTEALAKGTGLATADPSLVSAVAQELTPAV
jgi:hypothetical protein